MNLEITHAVRERLERLRDETDADSLAEVIRKALAVYDLFWTQTKKGGKVVIRDTQGDKEVLIL